MKKLSLIIGMLLFFGCEPDDICSESTSTTPRLVISFFDINNIENNKTVGGLYAIAVDNQGNEIPVSGESVSSRSEITLPLNGSQNQSRFKLYKAYDVIDGVVQGNPDEITVAYFTETVYVSRACGYKNIYTIQGFSIDSDSDLWMISYEILTNNVNNENETHVKIYH